MKSLGSVPLKGRVGTVLNNRKQKAEHHPQRPEHLLITPSRWVFASFLRAYCTAEQIEQKKLFFSSLSNLNSCFHKFRCNFTTYKRASIAISRGCGGRGSSLCLVNAEVFLMSAAA